MIKNKTALSQNFSHKVILNLLFVKFELLLIFLLSFIAIACFEFFITSDCQFCAKYTRRYKIIFPMRLTDDTIAMKKGWRNLSPRHTRSDEKLKE